MLRRRILTGGLMLCGVALLLLGAVLVALDPGELTPWNYPCLAGGGLTLALGIGLRRSKAWMTGPDD